MAGECVAGQIADNEGQPCTETSDPAFCTEPACVAGACVAGQLPDNEGLACSETGNPCIDSACVSGTCTLVSAADGTLCGDGTLTPCTLPDSCSGGACAPNHVACGYVTSSGLCGFDVSPDKGVCVGGDLDGEACFTGDPEDPCLTAVEPGACEQSREFRLLFTPDGQLWPAHKLNASNPGQYYYNAVYDGSPGAEVTLSFTLPYPFVTQGATPVHVYDAAEVPTVDGCFDPAAVLPLAADGTQIAIDDWIQGTNGCSMECGPIDGVPTGTCSFDVTFTVPDSGQAYINLHLDYGLKGPHRDANPCNDAMADRYDPGQQDPLFGGWDALLNNESGNGPVRIANCASYGFEHTDGFDYLGDTVSSLNEFKRIEGVFGLVQNSASGAGVAGVALGLVRKNDGLLVQSSATDEDGYYTLAHRHQGKSAAYTVFMLMDSQEGSLALSHELQIGTKGWAEISFDVHTGTSAAVYGNNAGSGDICGLGGPGDRCQSGAECCSGKCNSRTKSCR